MKKLLIGLLAAGLMLVPAEPQVRAATPGTVQVRLRDTGTYQGRPHETERYLNRYAERRGYWLDGNGYARWDTGYLTGWHNDVYYRNGKPTRYRDNQGREHDYRVIW